MFSRVNGGVEQVFLNYTESLTLQGNEVVSVIHPWANIRKDCAKENLATVYSFGRNDFLAVRRLNKLIEIEKPSCIISHTKRATFLFKKTQTKVPKIAVCHTLQSFKELESASDAVIAITEHMHQAIIKSGAAKKKLFTVPNMVQLPKDNNYKEPNINGLPIIGASARFSDLKGIDVFIEALGELKKRGLAFKAKIAGDGKQKKKYLKLVHHLNLHNEISFLGWIDDKKAFYESLDVFCHPSLKESFGLVIVEAMMYSLPIVLTQISGPMEIVGDSDSVIMVPPSDPISLANGLEQIIRDHNLAKKLAFNAFNRAQIYSSRVIAPVLNEVVHKVCG